MGGGCGGGCPQQCAPACQQSCCGAQPQGQVITHLTTVHHHHVHHMSPAPPAPPAPPMPPPPPPQTFHTQQHVFECAQPPCPQAMPMPPAPGGLCSTCMWRCNAYDASNDASAAMWCTSLWKVINLSTFSSLGNGNPTPNGLIINAGQYVFTKQ